MAFFDLTLRTRASLLVDGEPSALISEHHGEIICVEGDDFVESVAGYVRAQKLHADLAADRGERLFDVCDSHSQEMCDLHALLYEPDGYGLKDKLTARFEAVGGDLLVLDYVLLDPRWRGLRVGLLAARKVVDLLGGGCGLVVADIAPLRRTAYGLLGVPAEWIPPVTRANRRAGFASLRSYFRRMGFERLGRSGYYAMSTTRVTPSGEELLRPKTSEE